MSDLTKFANTHMPEDIRERARAWGMEAFMKMLWINAFQAGWREAKRDEERKEGMLRGDYHEGWEEGFKAGMMRAAEIAGKEMFDAAKTARAAEHAAQIEEAIRAEAEGK